MSRYMAGRSLVAALYAAIGRIDIAKYEYRSLELLISDRGGVGGEKQ